MCVCVWLLCCLHKEAGGTPIAPTILPPSPPQGKPSCHHFGSSAHSQLGTGSRCFLGSWLPFAKGPSLPALSHWPIMQAILHATAEMRAAPRPLPSSDCKKVMSQPGVSCVTVWWNRSLKLGKRKKDGTSVHRILFNGHCWHSFLDSESSGEREQNI